MAADARETRPVIELEATHTHLYPGARGRVLAGDPAAGGEVLLSFADGGVARGTLCGDELTLGPHRTAAGTRIAPRHWRVAFEGTAPVAFRILARGILARGGPAAG